MTFRKLIGHLKTVHTHRLHVRRYCFAAGLYWQGLTHDLSKYSPQEFFESIKYWTGNRSPIDNKKDEDGISMCWLHHRGRNKHHWEMWLDNFERWSDDFFEGRTEGPRRPALKMPYKYALEMVCDFLGAGTAYNGGTLSIHSEVEWWIKKRQVAILHPETRAFVDVCFLLFARDGVYDTLIEEKRHRTLRRIYNRGGMEKFARKLSYTCQNNPEGKA